MHGQRHLSASHQQKEATPQRVGRPSRPALPLPNHALERAVRKFGGVRRTAILSGVRTTTVNYWRREAGAVCNPVALLRIAAASGEDAWRLAGLKKDPRREFQEGDHAAA